MGIVVIQRTSDVTGTGVNQSPNLSALSIYQALFTCLTGAFHSLRFHSLPLMWQLGLWTTLMLKHLHFALGVL